MRRKSCAFPSIYVGKWAYFSIFENKDGCKCVGGQASTHVHVTQGMLQKVRLNKVGN